MQISAKFGSQAECTSSSRAGKSLNVLPSSLAPTVFPMMDELIGVSVVHEIGTAPLGKLRTALQIGNYCVALELTRI